MRLSQFLKACGTSVSLLQLAFATPTSLRPQRASALPKAALAFALGCRSCFAFALQERLASQDATALPKAALASLPHAAPSAATGFKRRAQRQGLSAERNDRAYK
jgi:hypothetical protein